LFSLRSRELIVAVGQIRHGRGTVVHLQSSGFSCKRPFCAFVLPHGDD
jgi:hypothetical protein